jgi:hypothetical protein
LYCCTQSRRARKSVTVVTEAPVGSFLFNKFSFSKFSHTLSVWLVSLLFSHLRLGLLGRLLRSFHVSVSSASHFLPPHHHIFVWR